VAPTAPVPITVASAVVRSSSSISRTPSSFRLSNGPLYTIIATSTSTAPTVTVISTASPLTVLSNGPNLTTTLEIPQSSNQGELSLTATMTPYTSSSLSTYSPHGTDAPTVEDSSISGSNGAGHDRTLVIALSTVLSVVGCLMVVGGLLICWRYRRRRVPFLSRGVTPIDDEEIATWKSPRTEKAGTLNGDTDAEADAATTGGSSPKDDEKSPVNNAHGKKASTSSVKKPPSVIVYSNAQGQGRQSLDYYYDSESPGSARTVGGYSGKTSLDKALPRTPIQARAPNSRAGLTDESIPGDDPFIVTTGLKRQQSRLSKLPPTHRRSSSYAHHHHRRGQSSRSSTATRSMGAGDFGGYASDIGVSSPRYSHEQAVIRTRSSHSRIYSSSSIPPRLSFGDEALTMSQSLPSTSPWFRDDDIGRAIG